MRDAASLLRITLTILLGGRIKVTSLFVRTILLQNKYLQLRVILMKTSKTLLVFIATAEIVACGKDYVSYVDLNRTKEMTKSIYSFDGKTVAGFSLSI